MRYLILFSTLVALLILPGCANTMNSLKGELHGGVDAVCALAHKGVDLGIGAIGIADGAMTDGKAIGAQLKDAVAK